VAGDNCTRSRSSLLISISPSALYERLTEVVLFLVTRLRGECVGTRVAVGAVAVGIGDPVVP